MFEVEIDRGMGWLDTQDAATSPYMPWFWRIDTAEAALNMSRGYDCVLGQSRPGNIGFSEIVDVFGWQWMADHGFSLESWSTNNIDEDRITNWRLLANEWRVAIRQRRMQVPV